MVVCSPLGTMASDKIAGSTALNPFVTLWAHFAPAHLARSVFTVIKLCSLQICSLQICSLQSPIRIRAYPTDLT